MQFNINHIISGFKNLLKDKLGNLDPQTKQIALERYKHCASCPLKAKNMCSNKAIEFAVKDFIYLREQRLKGEPYYGCGCYLGAKIVSPQASCPIGKW